jgi:four helix bundle protein
VQDFRKLRVWQRAQELCVEVYRFSADFPPEERYGMTSQVRDAAVSIGANLAEGSKRKSPVDKARIFNIAESEAAEAMLILDVAHRIGYGTKGRALQLSDEYDTLLGQIETLRQRILDQDRKQ